MDEIKPNDKVYVLPFEAIVKINISGAFFETLKQGAYTIMEQFNGDIKEIPIILKELETRAPENFWEQQITTYLALLHAVEEGAKEQKLLVAHNASKFLPTNDSSPEASPES